MGHQAADLHLSGSRRASARVLAVTSGKGGVGKTNIAANLAICMAAANQRVLLMDADVSLANLDLVMGIRNRYNISHVVRGDRTMEEVIQAGPGGLRIICGASGLDRLADMTEGQQNRLLRHLSALQHETDRIVVDTAAGISSSVVGFCLAADHVLVVTTPEATAMADAYGMFKVLVRKGYQGPISVVVNMARNIAEGRRAHQRIAGVARRFLARDLYYAGTLLKDERLCEAVRARKPVVLAYPKAPISTSIATLAARLGGTDHPEDADGSFFGRLIRWLS
ncbi:MAG: MinD/ParA family protein [Sedimentisphaerales bacterium]|nr:MinD/ParA family protein [Sedimentisphaerales bacterium]